MKVFTSIFAIMAVCVGAQAYEFDKNVPADIRQQTTQDLNFMDSIQSETTSRLHQEIFGDVKGSTYTQFFNDRVHFIGLSGCGSPNAVACVKPWWDKKIFFTSNYIKFKHPQISRLMVVYHEARHTERENGNWGHARCPVPFLDENGETMKSIWTGAVLEGQAACDVTPGGSYGSSMILLKNVSKYCSNCNEKVKMDAGIYADDQFGRIIDAQARRDILEDLYE